MLLPPVVSRMFWFVGIQGMRTFAKKLRAWPTTYRGVRLREGMIFNAIAFEDQGTGGAAFRLMYGAFLKEIGALYGAAELDELSARIIEHGREWRTVSRQIVVLAKTLPMNDAEYDDWHASKGKELAAGLDEVARRFEGFADFEARFFGDLRTAIGRVQ
jgi:hypothetical protein